MQPTYILYFVHLLYSAQEIVTVEEVVSYAEWAGNGPMGQKLLSVDM